MKASSFTKPALSFVSGALLIVLSATSVHAGDWGNAHSTSAMVMQSKQTQADAQLLITSAAGNRLSVIKQLVAEGVDINTPALGDGTALMIAVQRGNMTMVEGLIELGANVNQPSPGDGNPLIVASKSGNLAMVKTLLKQGARIDAIVEGDETALINASSQGKMAVVKWLVEQGADVNLGVEAGTLTGSEFRTPLNRARNREVRDYLVSQGATE